MNDLEAVRRLAAEPTDESVARTWYRITKLQAGKAPRRRQHLIPAVAGLAVLALVAASLAVSRLVDSPPPPVATSPVAALMELAKAAEKGRPIAVGKGQFVRTDVTGTGGYCLPSGCELSTLDRTYIYDPHLGRFDYPGNKVFNPDGSEFIDPGGLEHPTIDWLASLPSDPDMLLARIRSELRRPVSEPPEDQMIWRVVRRIYFTCEIVLTPAMRAALLRVLAVMPALTVRRLVVNGVTLTAIGHRMGDMVEETLFDPATGHAVGFAVDPLTLGVATEYPAGQRSITGGRTDQATWVQSLT